MASSGGIGGQAWLAYAIAALSTLASVALISELPVSLLAGARHDDGWFWLKAESIGRGAWLGPYDAYTLIKGVGYPVFLAMSNAIGVPVTVAQATLYALAGGMLAWAIHRASGRVGLSITLLLVVQWQPAAFAWGRVLRDNIVAAQVLLALAFAIHAMASMRAGKNGVGWVAGAGLVAGWFWCTREDGVWLLPGLALLIGAGLAGDWRRTGSARRLLLQASVLVAGFAAMPVAVMTSNARHYGVFTATEVNSGGFAAAMASLQRVRVGDAVPFVPVPTAVRDAVYDVSASFARLRPILEDPANPWRDTGCLYATSCGDYAGGWFLWAVRDAAADIGVHASAEASNAFYAQVAREIAAACDAGRLECIDGGIGLMPAMDQFQWRNVRQSASELVRLLLWQSPRPPAAATHLDHTDVVRMWRFVGRPALPEPARLLGPRVSGWFRAPDGGWIRGRCGPDGEIIPIERRASPDVAAHFSDPNAAASRFSETFPRIEGCVIEFAGGAGTLPLSSIGPGGANANADGGQLVVDSLRAGFDAPAPTDDGPLRVRGALDQAYRRGLPALAAVGLLAFVLACGMALRRRRFGPMLLISAAAWCLLASRIVLLLLVDISSFPAVRIHYLQPAFPLLIVAALASCASLLDLQQRKAGRAAGGRIDQT